MGCELASATNLVFSESGVNVVPLDVTITSNRSEYRHARVRVTREAGEHIHDNSDIPEAVFIYVADRQLARLYLPVDGITMKGDEAHLHLMDPRNTLKGGNAVYANDDVTLETLIEQFRTWIFDTQAEKVNPNNIISDIRIVEGTDITETSRSWDDKFDNVMGVLTVGSLANPVQALGNVFAITASEIPIARDVQHFALSALNSVTDLGGEDGGVDWDEISLDQALLDLEEEFSVSSWVDDEGVLWIGPYDSQPELFIAGNGANTWSLREYNITEDPLKTTSSYVRGDYYVRHNPEYGKKVTTKVDEPTTRLRMWGYAQLVAPLAENEDDRLYETEIGRVSGQEYYDIFGVYPEGYETMSVLQNRRAMPGPEQEIITDTANTTNGDVLAAQAERNLKEEIFDEKAGNLVINALASSPESGYPHDVSVGDLIGVFPNPNQNCLESEDYPTAFAVNSVQHKLDPSAGWTLTLDVGMIPSTPIISYAIDWEFGLGLGNNSEEFYDDVSRQAQARDWVENLGDEVVDAYEDTIETLNRYNPF